MPTIEELLAAQVPTENDLLADSPWYMAGRQIAGMQTPQAQNNTQAFLLPMLQGLAGGGLMGYGKEQAYKSGFDQYRQNPLLSSLAGVTNADGTTTPSIYSSDAMPEGWTPTKGKTDLLQALSAKQITDEQAAKNADYRAQAEAQILKETDPRIMEKEGLKTSAEIEKERIKLDAKANEEKAKNLRDDEKLTYDRIEALPEAKKLSEVKPNFKLASELVGKDDIASGKAFVKAIIKIQDPTSVISGTEIKVAEDVIPKIEQMFGANWRKYVTGQASLTPAARKVMLDAVTPMYNEIGSTYNTRKNEILDVFSKKGGDKSMIPVQSWEPLGGSKRPPPPNPGESKADYIARLSRG